MIKEIDVARLDTDHLRTLIVNHRKKGATGSQLYLDALRELESRTGGGLDFDKSYQAIQRAAAERRFLSYKELADASGAEWSKVHYAMGGHLWRLVEYAHRKGRRMLSAIVVNQRNIATGKMEPETLKGFMRAARDLGHAITEEEDFLKEQQELVFRWGSSS